MKNKFIKEYFDFSSRERNGIIVLAIILVVIIIFNYTLRFINTNRKINYEKFENQINSFTVAQQPTITEHELFFFDPNFATEEDFLKLGFSNKTIKSILNFRNKGGKFYKVEDFQKIYNISEEEFEQVKNYIIIQNHSNKKKYNKKEKIENIHSFDPNIATKKELTELGFQDWQVKNIINYREKFGYINTNNFSKIYGIDKKTFDKYKNYLEVNDDSILNSANSQNPSKFIKKENVYINLNTATAEELQKISGIGPSFSNRIIEYKNKLGGFINEEQLKEIYGFTDELYNSIEENIFIDEINIKKININTADYMKLISHPYIDKANANLILNYKKFAGKINSIDELVKQKAITEEFYDKIKPYLKTE
ncbi:MAG: helix-hairpin-helix domain-containing protein [Bacteroidales bacterium]|jgi:competence ComEA-like helix-hairpin-helix protein|nr:helix-hairpin-helix domain-containing protein [Bacteroidales bacterium]